MNKIYRTVYNETTNTWTAVAEIAKAKGKSKSSKTVVASVAVAGALLSSAAVQRKNHRRTGLGEALRLVK